MQLNLPYLLIGLRLLLAPIVLFLAMRYGESVSTVILFLAYLGLFSDIFDGIIARKKGLSTEKMRRIDSQVDLIFWLAIAWSCYLIFPILLQENIPGILALLVMEACCYLISFIKFGKETCTHALVSKLWGLTLLATFTSILGFAYAGWVLQCCIVIGLISQIDVILIILILPNWKHDIPSFYHAILTRKGIPFKKSDYLNS